MAAAGSGMESGVASCLTDGLRSRKSFRQEMLAKYQQFLKIACGRVDTSSDTQTATGNGITIMTSHVEHPPSTIDPKLRAHRKGQR